jgi:hypothetical protein
MKQLILLLIMLNFSFHLFAQDDSSAIRDVMNKQIEAWNKGDIDGFMQTYWNSDSLTFIGTTEPTYGWQTTLENYKKNYPDTTTMGKLLFNIINFKPISANYYFVIGAWHLTRSIGDIGGYFTLLFKKINGRWVIVVDHTS